MKSKPTSHAATLAACALALLLAHGTAWAQFAAFVLPARFELKAKPGEKLADAMEIGNDDNVAVDLRFRTADWTLKADGAVDFRADTLAFDSCREWVRIERYTLKLGPKAKRKYRFEVEVPKDAKEGLCRFAILIEPATSATVVAPFGNLQLPVQGRIGVIVYVRIGDAMPKLSLEGLKVGLVNGRPTPVAVFRNDGNAQGRPDGVLAGTDAGGKQMDLTVSPLPILPGETRSIPLWPQDDADGKTPALVFPMRVKGTIEWEGGKQAIDTSIKP